MNERLEATVRGVVQGVGFRWFIISEARRIGVRGWTANVPDGTVRVVAEGPPASLEKLLRVLHEGPRGASVEAVEARRLPAAGEFKSFTIRPGAHAGD